MSNEWESERSDLERLRAMYQESPAPEPDESAWNQVRLGIHQTLGAASATPFRRPYRPWVLAAVGTAAAVMAGLILMAALSNSTSPPTASPIASLEPFPVAETDDVFIVSMDARDAAALVVGDLPVRGEMEFAQTSDIRVIRCERCPRSGRRAELEEGKEVTMFVSAAVPPDDK
jgi:hypothetical protein